MPEKTDLSSAYRRLKSPNAKTRDRALKIIKEFKHKKNDKLRK
ncbi:MULTISPECIES: putative metal homeostasis protein [unclassified Leuconostoc]|nr:MULTISPECIES: putative metal homeostasis protein [unclassified Leuconostoc]MBK0041281.1 putative metal homeostasis protein [Leuconostoc sp. S51]MBK0051468.1 putative metal homeostasis protein [Leuconostoc sp. S50]